MNLKQQRKFSNLIIAVDFDGTIVKHAYPAIGDDIGAFPILHILQKLGTKLILNTMRSDTTLEDAVFFCKQNGIEFYGVNENPTQKQWTNSPKVYAHMYIDDAALGTPLKLDEGEDRSYVDWEIIARMLGINI